MSFNMSLAVFVFMSPGCFSRGLYDEMILRFILKGLESYLQTSINAMIFRYLRSPRTKTLYSMFSHMGHHGSKMLKK